MGVQDLGLTTEPTGRQTSDVIDIYNNGGLNNIYVMFSTESGTDWQDTVDVSCSYRVVSKYPEPTGSSYSDWSPFYWSHLDAGQYCNPHQVSGSNRWWWAIPLNSVGVYKNGGTDPNPFGNIAAMLFEDGYTFANRVYDSIQLQIHVKTNFNEGMTDANGNTSSNLAENNSITIAYIPDYDITSVGLMGDHILIQYETPNWYRPDDRFYVESLAIYGGTSILKTGTSPWNTIDGYSTGTASLSIPYSWLSKIPENNDQLMINIHMNPAFNSAGPQYGAYMGGLFTIKDKMMCSTPTMTVLSADKDEVRIQLGDAKDYDTSYIFANCFLEDGVASTDEQQVDNGGVYTIKYPPLGRDFNVYAVGIAGNDLSSKVYSFTAPAINAESKMFIAPLDTGYNQVEIRYNMSEEWTYGQTQEEVKFAFRPYESVAFGYGGSATGKVEFDIIDDDMYGEFLYQDRVDFENLMFAGLCILRGPDGERKRVAVEDVSIKWDRYRRFRTVSISLRQVP